jgi:inhibitor of cysteine peptidase
MSIFADNYKSAGPFAFIAWLAFLSPAFTLSAAVTSKGEVESRECAVSEIVLTSTDHGRSISVPVGSVLIVHLPESPTTGYAWADKTVGDILRQERSDFSADSRGLMGGGGERTLRFLVVDPGTTTLTLKQMRDWEAESSVTAIFSVVIHAKQP